MVIKILLLLTLVTACGQNTQISNSKELEGTSFITTPNSDNTTYTHTGTLQRKSSSDGQDVIIINGNYYVVSMHSSYNALEFVAARPLGSSVPVKCKGKITQEVILLEALTNQ